MSNRLNIAIVTALEIESIHQKFYDDGLLFRCDFAQLSKNFLSHFLSANPFTSTFRELRDEYLKESNIKDVPEGEQDFHKFICKLYFNTVKEPREALLDYYLKATEHIKEIDDRLEWITKESLAITNGKDQKTFQAKMPVLHYFKQHNMRAKEEIISFLKNGIKRKAENASYDLSSPFSFLINNIPYQYDWARESFKVHFPGDFSNKHIELMKSEIEKLESLEKTNEPEFIKQLDDIIQRDEKLFTIRESISKHHVLHMRSGILNEALQTYETGSKSIFANAIVLQIEGIFHDMCSEFGADENDLLQETLQPKLDRLLKHLGGNLNYEYYAFRFRVIRNTIAHGRALDSHVPKLARLLLLDLEDVCLLLNDMNFPVNKKLYAIHHLIQEKQSPNPNDLIQYLFLDKIVIPAFYDLDAQIAEVDKMLKEPFFWDFLDKQAQSGTEPIRHAIAKAMKILRKKPTFAGQSTAVLKKLHLDDVDETQITKYLQQQDFSDGL
jgi:hypothetical protein